MKLDVCIPRSSLDQVRKLFHPTPSAVFYSAIAASVAARLVGQSHPAPLWRALELGALLGALSMAVALFRPRTAGGARGLPYLLLGAFGLALARPWWPLPAVEPARLALLLVGAAGVLHGTRRALVLAATVALLELAAAPRLETAALPGRFVLDAVLLAAAAVVFGRFTAGQRSKISALREELLLAQSSPLALSWHDEGAHDHRAEAPAGADLESLDRAVASVLGRIRDYFCAYSVVLYQPYGNRELVLRHAVSDSKNLDSGCVAAIADSLLGRVYARGVACNWKLDDPSSRIGVRELVHYASWEPVRHSAACPLELGGRKLGLLVVDRTTPRPFTELEIVHLETFAIQLVEMIHVGRLYRAQVDSTLEYRLFYDAISELGRSLAPEEVVESLAEVCQRVASSSHVIVALSDGEGTAYQVAAARGAEALKGERVPNRGTTWISWLLASEGGPLMLKDVRSHASRMPIAAPAEGNLPVRSILMLPLVGKQQKLGVLVLGSTLPDFFRSWHLRMLKTICQQAASSLENSLLHRRVEAEAVSDGLTQLYNHRYFQDRLKNEVSRARRSGRRLSLLIADLDHFKTINDTHGHRVGDLILQQVAAILKKTIRTEDAVARYGGEEFVVILTESDRKGALRMGERLRRGVERTSFGTEEGAVSISVSFGTSTFPDDAGEPWLLIERADQALYAAKQQGRNRVVQYHAAAAARPSTVSPPS